MKNIIFYGIIIMFYTSCKQDKKNYNDLNNTSTNQLVDSLVKMNKDKKTKINDSIWSISNNVPYYFLGYLFESKDGKLHKYGKWKLEFNKGDSIVYDYTFEEGKSVLNQAKFYKKSKQDKTVGKFYEIHHQKDSLEIRFYTETISLLNCESKIFYLIYTENKDIIIDSTGYLKKNKSYLNYKININKYPNNIYIKAVVSHNCQENGNKILSDVLFKEKLK